MYISRQIFVMMSISTIAVFVTLILVAVNLGYTVANQKCLEGQNVHHHLRQ